MVLYLSTSNYHRKIRNSSTIYWGMSLNLAVLLFVRGYDLR